jgi:hypothetical protein
MFLLINETCLILKGDFVESDWINTLKLHLLSDC